MAAPLDAPYSGNIQMSNTVLGQVTLGKGTSFPSTWEVNRIFLRTDTNQLYHNTGSEGTPVFTLVIAGPGLIYGNGQDGAFTDVTAVPSKSIIQATNITMGANKTWTFASLGPVIIYVSGTLQIDAGFTWTVHGNSGNTPNGGNGAHALTADGGPGAGSSVIVIVAKTVTAGAGAKILNDNTGNGSGGGSSSAGGLTANPGQNGEFGGHAILGSARGNGANGGRGSISNSLGPGGINQTFPNPTFRVKKVSEIIDANCSDGGGGGGASQGLVAVSIPSGGGGGAGGRTPWAAAGNGGAGGTGTASSGGGGGGGGGGAAALLIIITGSMDADCAMEALGSNGGAGGNASNANGGRGGGAGGGAASNVLVAPTDPGNTRSETGGPGGAAGSGTGVGGSAGVVGGTSDTFIDLDTLDLE